MAPVAGNTANRAVIPAPVASRPVIDGAALVLQRRYPGAVFSAKHSFSALWSNAVESSSYSLTPCIQIDGKWYIYSSSS